MTAATTAPTLIAQVNIARLALMAHFLDATAHGAADTTRYALAAATTVATSAATAIVLENLLVTYWKAHIATAKAVAGDVVTVNGLAYTGAASTAAATRAFKVAGASVSDDADELCVCLNDKDTITLASAVAGDSVSVNGIVYTGKASTAVKPTRQFSIDTNDTAAAVSIAALINDAIYGVPGVTATSAVGVVTLMPDTYGQAITMVAGVGGTNTLTRVVCKAGKGVPGVTAVNASGLVSLTRDFEATPMVVIFTNKALHSHRVFTLTATNGIPGVTAAVSDGGEVYIVPDWAGQTLTATSSDDTIAYAHYGLPGCSVASTATTVVITPDMDSAEPCTCIYAVIGTADADEFTVTNGTLANLQAVEGSARTGIALNSTTKGTLYEQYVDGMPHLYLGFTSADAAAVSVPVVKATLYA